jgi:hypothetical protein
VAVIMLPQLRPLVYAAWLLPLAELVMLAAGQLHYRWGFRERDLRDVAQFIVQITTAGGEGARVAEIIRLIRSYRLPLNPQVWVVTEPGDPDAYPDADLAFIVPRSFTTTRGAQAKCRALEYSRQVRQAMGLGRPDVVIVYNDDDVTLTEGYLRRALTAGYDVCQGVVSPRHRYATRPLSHFLASHADDIRTHACLVYCSVFQGILGRPLHVHGEGLVVTGEAERITTWDFPVVASEDLVFGQRAAKQGLRWGWFREYAEVTSPWSLGEFIRVQRARWTWGDIHAIRHRTVMSSAAASRVSLKYLVSVAALACSVGGLWLRVSGGIPATAGVLNFGKLSLLAWAGLAFTCGWLGASGSTDCRDDDSRLLAGVTAVLLMPVSVLITLAALVVPLAEGNPRSFRRIRKTLGVAR